MNKEISKNELLQKIEFLSEEAQNYLMNLLCHNLSNMPIEFEETPETVELESCGFIKRAITRDDFFEMNNSELEFCVHFLGDKIESEMTKNELIELIMQHSDKFLNFYIPVLTFSYKRAIMKYLSKKFNWVILEP